MCVCVCVCVCMCVCVCVCVSGREVCAWGWGGCVRLIMISNCQRSKLLVSLAFSHLDQENEAKEENFFF